MNEFILKRACNHGDWKTASVRPNSWPILPQGTRVTKVGEFQNYYGLFYKVLAPNGETYDIEEYKLEPVEG